MVHYRKQLWGVFHYVVLSVLQEVTVGHIACRRLHVTENVFPDVYIHIWPPAKYNSIGTCAHLYKLNIDNYRLHVTQRLMGSLLQAEHVHIYP